MNSLANTMLFSSHHYASQDSGLSSTSNSGDNEHRFMSGLDYHDDLTKSLFINSFNGSGLIQDDDIYTYKSKMESKSINLTKLLSFNLSKTDNIKTKNPNSLSNIFEDLAHLDSESNFPTNIRCTSIDSNDNSDKGLSQIIDATFIDKIEFEPVQTKKVNKKVRPLGVEGDYVSSSIQNYKGDKTINEIVEYIEGPSKKSSEKSNRKPIDIKIEESVESKLSYKYFMSDSGVFSDNTSPVSADATRNGNIDADSGTHSSYFVSHDNSEDDTIHNNSDFREVKSKSKRNSKKLEVERTCASASKLNTTKHNRINSNNKRRNGDKNSRNVSNKSQSHNRGSNTWNVKHIEVLDSKFAFQQFLSDQYVSFQKFMILILTYCRILLILSD